MNIDEARQGIALARRQLERVQAAEYGDDLESAVTWGFYAYENCVTALAARYGRRWTKNHREKAELARRLYVDGLVSRDVGDELEKLNRLRKDVAYDGSGLELEEEDLYDLAYQLEELIIEVESLIGSST